MHLDFRALITCANQAKEDYRSKVNYISVLAGVAYVYLYGRLCVCFVWVVMCKRRYDSNRKYDSLTRWGWVTHICVGNLAIIGSDNGLSPDRRQAIIWTNAGIMLIGPLEINFFIYENAF